MTGKVDKSNEATRLEDKVQPDVKQVIEYSQAFAMKDMEKVKSISSEQDVTSEVIYMIGKITKSQEAMNYLAKNQEREKDYNMCEFITELIQDGEARGEARGIMCLIETLEEMGVPKEQIVDRLIKKLKITVEEALGYFAVREVK